MSIILMKRKVPPFVKLKQTQMHQPVHVQGNESEMCNGRVKGTFVSKNVINLSERNLKMYSQV